ncbi:hypothetical protein [Stenotrophomonas sp.]|uniref:hypothetical protein n=1 Tax=Stenotrophomonas sp. TaxID=69392 RepID=UPI002899777E|nr:hypothetical protein [Stenotrophomonas sp.]
MANPWDNDEIVVAAPPRAPVAMQGNPWDEDPVVGDSDMPITDLPTVQAGPPDFSDVTATVDSTASDNAPDGWKYGPVRDAAFGVRSALQGAGGLLGAIGGDAFNNYVVNPVARAVGMQEARPYREEARALADRIGLPQAQTSGDRVAGDVGEALTGTALTLGVGSGINALANMGRQTVAPATNRLAQFLTTQPAMQAVSAAAGSSAASATKEAGGSEGQQLLAGLAGGLGPSLLTAGGGATMRGLVRGRSGEQMRNRLADFEALGATPSVGQASGNQLVQGAENLLAGGPTSAGVMGRFVEQQADDIGGGLARIANDVTPNASAERAGRAVERGVETFNKNVGATRRALYWQADQHIPDTTQTPMRNTVREIIALTTPDPAASATTGSMIQPTIARLRKNIEDDLAANGGNLTYGVLRKIRSEIGEQIGDASPLNPPSDLRELKRLYAALSSDMTDAAKAQGPDAVAAATRANNYTRASADRLDAIQRVVEKAGGPEKVYLAVMSGTKDGGTTLRSVLQSLPEEGQKAVTGAVLKRMGMATPGAQDATGEAFSAATFLTNWNKVSPEARRALFDRYGPGFTKQVDQIARVADNIKSGAKVYANPSGTANRAAAMTYGASLVGSLLTGNPAGTAGLVASGAGANGLARWLTNPNTVKMLANATTIPESSFPAFINFLTQQATKLEDPDIADLAAELGRAQNEVGQARNDGNQANNRNQQELGALPR